MDFLGVLAVQIRRDVFDSVDNCHVRSMEHCEF